MIELALNCTGYNMEIIEKKPERLLEYITKLEKKTDYKLKVTRIYIGSEFCCRLLERWDFASIKKLIELISSNKLGVTFVIPPTIESELDKIKDIIQYLLFENRVDEIVINDFGILSYVIDKKKEIEANTKLIVGRLFNKLSRDPRVLFSEEEGLTSEGKKTICENGLLVGKYQEYFKNAKIENFETDLFSDKSVINPDLFMSYHYPLVYITMGQICATASYDKSLSNKFKLNNQCSFGCCRYYGKVENEEFLYDVYQYENAYLYKENISISKIIESFTNKKRRIIYTFLEGDNI